METSLLLMIGIGGTFLVLSLFQYLAESRSPARIKRYLHQRGNRFISAEWTPFELYSFGEKEKKFYLVRYLDRDDNEHEAYARISMWSGVHFIENRVIRYANSLTHTDYVQSLEEENACLRAELDRLKRMERERGSEAIRE